MIHDSTKIPYDMKCANCFHDASDHWYSDNGSLWSGICHACSYPVCTGFKWSNLNYLELAVERKEER